MNALGKEGQALPPVFVPCALQIYMSATARLADVPVDALRCALAFLPGRDAVRARRTSRGMAAAFDRLCWVGPADAARVDVDFYSAAERRLLAAVDRAGGAPLWLRMVAWSPARLLAAVSGLGMVAAVEDLTAQPFLLGQKAAKAERAWALREACAKGHVAVVERLTQHPFLLDAVDVRGGGSGALRMACANGHVAVVERLTQPPFNLDRSDAQADDNYALRMACSYGHLAVVERLAQHPFVLSKPDAQARAALGGR